MIETIVACSKLPQWRSQPLVGIFPGEGIGPEVVQAATDVLDAVATVSSVPIERQTVTDAVFGAHGHEPGASTFYQAAKELCADVFARHGAVLCGPLGGRGVYDLRRHFDLFCKLAPIQPLTPLAGATRFKPEVVGQVDFIIVRDNAAGVYQGRWSDGVDPVQGRIAEHCFAYSQMEVERIVKVGARLAGSRRRRMHVVIKDGGVPAISDLWRQVAQQAAAASQVDCVLINADYAAYQFVHQPGDFDVVVTPNMVGDILADLAAAFLGSRGMSYSANFSCDGQAVYQTGHGAARNLAGTDRANPLAQILSLAMLLRESLGLDAAAACVEGAISDVLRAGWRTDDLAEPGCRCVGTRRMGDLVAQSIVRGGRDEACAAADRLAK